MAPDVQFDLVLSSIAAVLVPSETPQTVSLNEEVLTAFLRRPINIGQSVNGATIISSNREQVEIHLFPNKVDVREVSGVLEQGSRKIPRILDEMLAIMPNAVVTSYGLNFIIEVPKEGPGEWLAQNLLNPSLASNLNIDISSDQIGLVFDRGSKIWTVRFEVRPGDTINLNFSASEQTDSWPSQEQLGHELTEQYEALMTFLKELKV